MPNMNDMLRSMAAGGATGAGGASDAMGGDTATDQGAPPTDAAPPSADVGASLDAIEAAFEQAPPDVGDEARKHVLALRDLSTKLEAAVPDDEGAEAQPPSPDGQPTSAVDQAPVPQM